MDDYFGTKYRTESNTEYKAAFEKKKKGKKNYERDLQVILKPHQQSAALSH